jgi:HEAT repeat protein
MRHQIACLALLGLGACAPQPVVKEAPPPDPIVVLQKAARAADPLLRANAIEALATAPAEQADVLKFGLVDTNEGVRFVAAMCLGDGAHCDLIDLVRPLQDDVSESVQAAALYALSSCGEPVSLSLLADMMFSNDATSRSNASLILGRMGNASAADMLSASLGRPIVGLDARRIKLVELATAEALVRLGNQDHLAEIRAAFFGSAEDGEVIAVAAQIAGQLGDTGLGYALEQMAFNAGPRPVGPELQLIAVEALGRMTAAAAQPALALQYVNDDAPAIRAQAASALAFGNIEGQNLALLELCADPNPHVRVRAAGSVLHRRQQNGPAH